MLRTILVPLDGSVLSEKAVLFARGLARPAGAKLLLMRAVLQAKASVPGAEPFNETAIAQAEEELAEAAARAREPQVSAEYFVWDDEAGWAITDAAREKGADLIVMSTHGRTGLGRALYGSVADRVLRSSPVPVLLVPPGGRYSFVPPIRFVIPLDGSSLAEEALPPTMELAEAVHGEVIFVRAVEQAIDTVTGFPTGEGASDQGAELEEARRYLDSIAERRAAHGLSVTGYAAVGTPDEVIFDAVRNYRASAIAMATHGRSGLGRLIMGSVTQQVLRRTAVPLLVVRPPAARVEHVHVQREPVVETPDVVVSVLMNAEELRVTRVALEKLLDQLLAESDESTARPARALLERLDGTLAGEPVSSGRGDEKIGA